MPKPFPLYTDGSNLYTTFDGGATLITLESAGGLVQTAAPVSGDGSVGNKITIASAALPLTALATQANNTVVGNIAGTASPVALTATQLTALINPATSSLPGAMSAAQFTALQNVGEYELTCDLTTTGDQGIIVPARVGQIFVVSRISQIVLAVTGTASGTAPTVSIGVSASFNNTAAAVAVQTTTNINVGPGQFSSINLAASNGAAVTNSALHVSCGTAVTGATVLSVRVSVFGYWTAF